MTTQSDGTSHIGHLIRRLRFERGVKQKELEYITGMSRGLLTRIERTGAIQFKYLIRIADFFGLSTSALIYKWEQELVEDLSKRRLGRKK